MDRRCFDENIISFCQLKSIRTPVSIQIQILEQLTHTSSYTQTCHNIIFYFFVEYFSCHRRQDGFYTDVFDCSKYYVCENRRTFHYICPKDLYYNPRKQICDWITEVNCVIPPRKQSRKLCEYFSVSFDKTIQCNSLSSLFNINIYIVDPIMAM